jgi:hypothetical protein
MRLPLSILTVFALLNTAGPDGGDDKVTVVAKATAAFNRLKAITKYFMALGKSALVTDRDLRRLPARKIQRDGEISVNSPRFSRNSAGSSP